MRPAAPLRQPNPLRHSRSGSPHPVTLEDLQRVVRELAARNRERACPEWEVGLAEETKGRPPRLRRPRPPLRSPLALHFRNGANLAEYHRQLDAGGMSEEETHLSVTSLAAELEAACR